MWCNGNISGFHSEDLGSIPNINKYNSNYYIFYENILKIF